MLSPLVSPGYPHGIPMVLSFPTDSGCKSRWITGPNCCAWQ